ncbi:d-tyrosyl-trna deacylase [Malassezia pachydermatis]|uniref:D-aminoacyl-tRNA deacylase n=1 Tax=Malassezia pachydermatis TaxID=77020 RepID=A0A0M8MMQ5_9BASI|nr:d-tyrosyl-trna deacylase [Malassezia pachydermatis]KOS13227.1 d-tyrosyl-trna deacylase [Malassezia pachydermatis]
MVVRSDPSSSTFSITMRAVLQRVKQASVHVNGRLVSSIGPGILALVGVCQDDTPEQIETLVRRILGIRLWPDGTAITDGALHYTDEGKPWRMNVTELGGEVLCVSQFTLYARMKGTKPDFHLAMGGTTAQPFYEDFLAKMRSSYASDKVFDGEFGAMMDVSLINDGPVTISTYDVV